MAQPIYKHENNTSSASPTVQDKIYYSSPFDSTLSGKHVIYHDPHYPKSVMFLIHAGFETQVCIQSTLGSTKQSVQDITQKTNISIHKRSGRGLKQEADS